MLRPTPYNLRPKSFTLVELLVALAMFSYLIMVISGVFISMQRAERRGSAENYLVTESRFMLEKIIREIRKGTIDYEEYYSRIGAPSSIKTTNYGKNYGKYGQNFFDLGTPDRPGCADKNGADLPSCSSSNVSKASMDQNTGKNPSNSADATDELANSAFFNGEISSACASKYALSTVYDQEELYILTADGREKIMFRWDKGKKELQLLKLEGDDSNQNGIPDKWTCHPDWNSVNISKCAFPDIINTDFLNITPNGIQITDVKFIISPLEDPYKAFYENSFCDKGLSNYITIRHQPKITIVMTGEIDNSGVNSPFKGLMKGDTPNVTIQTTVSTMVYQDIPSYHPLTGGA